MTTHESANADAFADVFARDDRDRGADAAAPEAPAGQPRNTDGTFAEKSETPPPVQQQEAPPPAPSDPQDDSRNRHVPLTELLSEREKRKAADQRREEAERRAIEHEAMLKAYQRLIDQQQRPSQQAQQQTPPDFFTDPDAAIQHHLSRIEQAALNRHINQSERFARRAHGDKLVDEALAAAKSVGIAARFAESADPFDDLVSWHKRARAMAEVGDDPAAYRTRIETEVRAKVLAELKNGGASPASPQFPGSLAGATQQGSQGGHMSDQAMADAMFASNRNRKA